MARSRQTRRNRQRGGSTYAYTGPAGVSAGGVPFESRGAIDVHCIGDYRTPPQLGGRRKQRGGSCGCGRQLGGGGGSGGYGFDFGNNVLGKVYAALPVGACPAAPRANQLGGASEHDLVSYPSGYGFGSAGVMSTNSAHYLDPSRYNRTCMGGSRARTQTRKHRRRHHKK